MKDLTFETLIAVFEEIFGRGLFWGMVVAAVVVTLAYLYVLIRDRHISWRKFLLAQLSMPFGAVAAVWFVLVMTSSKLANIGGPIDVIILLMIAAGGAVGAAILVYTAQSFLAPTSEKQD
jgi:membrane-associated phospholipid phosphatase